MGAKVKVKHKIKSKIKTQKNQNKLNTRKHANTIKFLVEKI